MYWRRRVWGNSVGFAYYNEFKPEAAHMLRQLIKDGLIADGVVDERSITEVSAEDVREFTQCHFFAGIGGWSVALRMAGWPDDRPVWTGSCPCQPFSTAGKQKGKADERHLWPVWYRLIRECRPSVIFGEQVFSAIAHGWWDDVANDLEAEGYACGAAGLPACSVGKPHRRDRLWFVADAGIGRLSEPREGQVQQPRRTEAIGSGSMGDTPDAGLQEWRGGQVREPGQEQESERHGTVGNASGAVRQRGAGGLFAPEEGERSPWQQHGGLYQRPEHASEGSGSPMGNTKHDGPLIGSVAGSQGQAVQHHAQRTDNTGKLAGAGESSDVANPDSAGLQGHGRHEQQHGAQGRQKPDGYPRATNLQWISCPDGKQRPVKPGIRLLAHGVQHRAPVLHAFGNAIVPQVAAEFIKAFIHVRGLDLV